MEKIKKLGYTTIIMVVSLSLILFIAAASVVIPVSNAYAEEEKTEEEEQPKVVIVEKEKDDELMTVFKNNILPYIVSAGETVIALLIMLIPYIKLRGKNNTLQGALSVASRTIDQYKAIAGKVTNESIIEAIDGTIVPELKEFLLNAVKSAVAENVKDTTGDINKIESNVDILSMQIGNLLKAASLAWGDVDGAKELLMKSPTAQSVVKLLGEVKALKAKVESQNCAQIEPINEVIEQLEGYKNENE